MINHSKKTPNIIPRLVNVHGTPHVFFYTKMPIAAEEELLYDYGDHSSSAKKAHPWLAE